MYFKKYIVLLLMALCSHCFTQNNSLFLKYHVKEKTVLLRWVPLSKQTFDLAVQNGYKVTRFTKENTTASPPVIIAENIKPYPYSDSINWVSLIERNENSILIIKALYENKNSNNIPAKEKEGQEKMLYNIMLLSCDFDADIAKACGLYLKDSTIENTKSYTYKIEINNIPPSSKISFSNIEVNAEIFSVNPEINILTAIFKNKVVNLKWKVKNFTEYYSGYNIERSSDSIDFIKINKAPVILLSSQFEVKKEDITYSDTVSKTKSKYYYRIKGINHFGEESGPSNIVSGTGYDELQSNPVFDTVKVIRNQNVRLHWKMQDEKENILPKEYILLRSEKDNGAYSILYKSAGKFSFTDTVPAQSNYYKIGAITYSNDTLYSYSSLALIVDTIPPSAPAGLQAKVDPKGKVEITWTQNPESDIQGYKIYKANTLTEEFVQINNEFAKIASYSDMLKLNTLSKKIYYSVVATDNNFNNSELSKPVEVTRPDTIPPVSAVLRNLQIMQNGIKSFWIPGSSDDVKQYMLYRQNEQFSSDTLIKSWSSIDTISSFLDTNVNFGTGYRYKIVTMDENHNMSISNSSYMFFETGFRKKITDIKAETDGAKKVINLKWNYPEKEIEKFIIYRGKVKEPLTIIKTLPYSSLTFEDNTLNISNTYAYRIKAVFNNGTESIISNEVIVEY